MHSHISSHPHRRRRRGDPSITLPVRQAVPYPLHRELAKAGKGGVVDVVETSNEHSLAVLAALALDELTPIQLARVEERAQLVFQGDVPTCVWLSSRLSELSRAA